MRAKADRRDERDARARTGEGGSREGGKTSEEEERGERSEEGESERGRGAKHVGRPQAAGEKAAPNSLEVSFAPESRHTLSMVYKGRPIQDD